MDECSLYRAPAMGRFFNVPLSFIYFSRDVASYERKRVTFYRNKEHVVPQASCYHIRLKQRRKTINGPAKITRST
jgi:hypothetical protein